VLLDVVDFGLSIQEACAAPLIDCSGPEVLVDGRVLAETRERLEALGHALAVREATFWPRSFASPTGVQVDRDGRLRGGADPYAYGVAVGY
jgi:gamma-glutamyltranspeptidase/glutathione hydrolase